MLSHFFGARFIVGMFLYAPLNKPINFSNTQGLTSLAQMFANAPNFSQPITMDIPNVVSVDSMFSHSTSFHQPVWRVQPTCFIGASSFNQPLTLDTSSVIFSLVPPASTKLSTSPPQT